MNYIISDMKLISIAINRYDKDEIEKLLNSFPKINEEKIIKIIHGEFIKLQKEQDLEIVDFWEHNARNIAKAIMGKINNVRTK